jgi:23S rRNA (cytidine1920-2'-O)/16S rRNA (cytidine1409-2'-O)-methyltransferase
VTNVPATTKKERLDVLLVQLGLAPTRQQAQALILAGSVRVAGQLAGKAGTRLAVNARLEVLGPPMRYASRGGLKLEGALEDFGVDVGGKTCADIGSSNGGFTDCLLQRGAARVYAVDVTTSQLDWKLQQDARVRQVKCNARYLRAENIGELVAVVTIDVSFIAAEKILPAATQIAGEGAEFLILVKPQFELEKRDVGKGGIVRDVALHERAVERVWQAAERLGLRPLRSAASRVAGAEGNQEFFLHARKETRSKMPHAFAERNSA